MKSEHFIEFNCELLGVVKCTFKTQSGQVFKGENAILKNLKTKTLQRISSQKLPKIGGLKKLEEKLKSTFSNFLISGPSGSGKSTLVNKVFHSHLILRVNCSTLMRPIPGEMEKLLKNIFKKAEMHSKEGKTLLLFEDVDLIGNSAKEEVSHNLRAISQLKTLLDQFSGKSLKIGATTCHPSNIHESLRRSGRFSHEIFIQVPNLQERQEIIQALSDFHPEKCLEIAQITQGYLASDLKSLVSYLNFGADLKEVLRLTAPSGFKSGIGSVELTPLSWDQIGGLQNVKKVLESAVTQPFPVFAWPCVEKAIKKFSCKSVINIFLLQILWPLLHPEKYKKLDLKRAKGVLLFGPPGCGKTTLVRAMASTAGATFLSISAATIFSPYVGDSEKSLTQVFHKARLGAPSVLFIDEIDGLVTNRDDSDGSNGVQERVLSVLLNEMDGIGSGSQVSGCFCLFVGVFKTFQSGCAPSKQQQNKSF